MERLNQLHTRPNGVWSLRFAEINKWIFFKAYLDRIDAVAFNRALHESKAFIEHNEQEVSSTDSKLLRKWKTAPPANEDDLRPWIAIHQQHLFTDDSLRGALMRSFPALRKEDQVADVELTRLFYKALVKCSKDI